MKKRAKKLRYVVAEKIKELRESASMTQAELAHFLGCTQQRIAKFESGEANPRLDTIVKVFRALEYDIEITFR